MSTSHVLRPAVGSDTSNLVDLQEQLFIEDAGVHGTHVDLSWPKREGPTDITNLLASSDSLVLIAEKVSGPDPDSIGFLVGFVSRPNGPRQPVDIAILRSLFVSAKDRGQGIGRDLCRRFIRWSIEQECVEAHVSAYVANNRAQQMYESLGFAAVSTSRVLSLSDWHPSGD